MPLTEEELKRLEGLRDRLFDSDAARALTNEAGRAIDALLSTIRELREALDRIAKLTPEKANARTARDLHLTVKAIAACALDPAPRTALGERHD